MPRKATKTRKTAKKAAPAVVRQLRAEYGTITKAYHKAGKAAFGKPANSAAKREYNTIKQPTVPSATSSAAPRESNRHPASKVKSQLRRSS